MNNSIDGATSPIKTERKVWKLNIQIPKLISIQSFLILIPVAFIGYLRIKKELLFLNSFFDLENNERKFENLWVIVSPIIIYLILSLIISLVVMMIKGRKLKSYKEHGLIRGLIKGLIFGLVIGFAIGLMIGLFSGSILKSISGLIFGLALGLAIGLMIELLDF